MANICFWVILAVIALINLWFAFSNSDKEIIRELRKAGMFGKVSMFIIYCPTLLSKIVVDLAQKSYHKHKDFWSIVGSILLLAIFLMVLIIWIPILHELGFK